MPVSLCSQRTWGRKRQDESERVEVLSTCSELKSPKEGLEHDFPASQPSRRLLLGLVAFWARAWKYLVSRRVLSQDFSCVCLVPPRAQLLWLQVGFFSSQLFFFALPPLPFLPSHLPTRPLSSCFRRRCGQWQSALAPQPRCWDAKPQVSLTSAHSGKLSQFSHSQDVTVHLPE